MPSTRARPVSRRRAGRRSRKGRGRGNYGRLVEVFRFDVEAGTDLKITPSMLSLAPYRVWRPVTLRVEAIGGYVQAPANAESCPGGIVPVAIQLDLCDPSGNFVNTSGVRVFGAMPRNVFCRYPSSGDWYQPKPAANATIGVISGVCLGAVNNAGSQRARIRGVAHFSIKYGPEATSNSCPAPKIYTSSLPECECESVSGTSSFESVFDGLRQLSLTEPKAGPSKI